MPNVYSLLMRIPDELKPWVAIGLGSFILVCLVLFHGGGIHWILQLHRRAERRLLLGRPHILQAIILFGISVFLMLALHLIGVMAWALILLKIGFIQRAHDAIYFCANAYTTLGYGSVDLDPAWRNISPIIGISGLFTFAWTTSVLVTIVTGHNRLLEQLHLEDERKLYCVRICVHRSGRCVKKKAKPREHCELLQESGRLRRDCGNDGESGNRRRKKALDLRKGELTEIARLFKEEREEEDKLGPGKLDSKE